MKKDNSKFWCKFCRVFVYDNKISRSNHDKQAGHKANVDRFIREIESKKTLELKTTNMAKQLLGIPITERSNTGSSNLYIPTSSDTFSTKTGPIVKFKETKATVGEVGNWETVETVPAVSVEADHSGTVDLKNGIDYGNNDQSDGKEKDVKERILELNRSVLSIHDSTESLNLKSAPVSTDKDSKGELAIKKRVFKGRLKKS